MMITNPTLAVGRVCLIVPDDDVYSDSPMVLALPIATVMRSALLVSLIDQWCLVHLRHAQGVPGGPVLDLTMLHTGVHPAPTAIDVATWRCLVDLTDDNASAGDAHALCLPRVTLAQVVKACACMQATTDVRLAYDRLICMHNCSIMYCEYVCAAGTTVTHVPITMNDLISLDVQDGRLHSALYGLLAGNLVTSRYIIRALHAAVRMLIGQCTCGYFPGLRWRLCTFYNAHSHIFESFSLDKEQTLERMAVQSGHWTYTGVSDVDVWALSGIAVMIPGGRPGGCKEASSVSLNCRLMHNLGGSIWAPVTADPVF